MNEKKTQMVARVRCNAEILMLEGKLPALSKYTDDVSNKNRHTIQAQSIRKIQKKS